MADQQVVEFWQAFVAETGIDGPYTAWSFGNSATDADQLGRLVRDGPKRATASLRSAYGADEPVPAVGDLSVILDGRGEPLCVIRTTHVQTRSFGDVDEAFAWTEGEGDRSLAFWREAHIRAFASVGHPVRDEDEIVLETFELLWPERESEEIVDDKAAP
jgi:uncharacterized protein YhfF